MFTKTKIWAKRHLLGFSSLSKGGGVMSNEEVTFHSPYAIRNDDGSIILNIRGVVQKRQKNFIPPNADGMSASPVLSAASASSSPLPSGELPALELQELHSEGQQLIPDTPKSLTKSSLLRLLFYISKTSASDYSEAQLKRARYILNAFCRDGSSGVAVTVRLLTPLDQSAEILETDANAISDPEADDGKSEIDELEGIDDEIQSSEESNNVRVEISEGTPVLQVKDPSLLPPELLKIPQEEEDEEENIESIEHESKPSEQQELDVEQKEEIEKSKVEAEETVPAVVMPSPPVAEPLMQEDVDSKEEAALQSSPLPSSLSPLEIPESSSDVSLASPVIPETPPSSPTVSDDISSPSSASAPAEPKKRQIVVSFLKSIATSAVRVVSGSASTTPASATPSASSSSSSEIASPTPADATPSPAISPVVVSPSPPSSASTPLSPSSPPASAPAIDFSSAKTDRGGYFNISAKISCAPENVQSLDFQLVLHEKDEREVRFSVPIIPTKLPLLILSDIDDTIRIAHVKDKAMLMKSTFFNPYESTPGMATIYQRLRTVYPEHDAGFHYVSGSPWQLQPTLVHFIRTAGFPSGTLSCRRLNWDLMNNDPIRKTANFKVRVMRQLLADLRPGAFIFFGDSGEQDPEVATALAKSMVEAGVNPKDKIAAVAIRIVDVAAFKPTRFDYLKSVIGEKRVCGFTDALELESFFANSDIPEIAQAFQHEITPVPSVVA